MCNVIEDTGKLCNQGVSGLACSDLGRGRCSKL